LRMHIGPWHLQGCALLLSTLRKEQLVELFGFSVRLQVERLCDDHAGWVDGVPAQLGQHRLDRLLQPVKLDVCAGSMGLLTEGTGNDLVVQRPGGSQTLPNPGLQSNRKVNQGSGRGSDT